MIIWYKYISLGFKSELLVKARTAERDERTFISGGRDGGRGASNGGKVNACLVREVNQETLMAHDQQRY